HTGGGRRNRKGGMGATAARRQWRGALVAVALCASACTHSSPHVTHARAVDTSDDPTTTAAATSTTAAEPTTTRQPGPPRPGLGRGARGAEVLALEQRLTDLKYDVGDVDGYFDSNTQFAVTAFQKVEGLTRDGWASPDILERVKTATS